MSRLRAGFLALVVGLTLLLGVAAVFVAREPRADPVAWIAGGIALFSIVILVSMRGLVRELALSNQRQRAEGRERAEIERKLRASRERLQLLLDHMPDGVVAFDAAGRVEWINPAARLIFQRSIGDTVGQPLARLIPGIEPAALEDAPSAPAGTVAANVPRLRIRGRRRDGAEFPLEVALVTLHAGDTRSGMCVCRDVSDFERVERMKSEFVSMVSHELRTPLTSLRGSLALLVDGSIEGIPPDARRMLRLASVNSERLVMLVNDILDFEKLRAGALRMEFESVDLCALVTRAIEALEGLARQAHVTHRVLAGADELPVRADPARLTQVLTNLLSNAIKYSPPHGTVLVIVEASGERARVTVRDQGPGVPEAFVPKLFLPFEQAREPRHRQPGGTGLGLAISRGLMEAMYGGIGLDPARPGEGASFWIELPLNRARPSTFADLD